MLPRSIRNPCLQPLKVPHRYRITLNVESISVSVWYAASITLCLRGNNITCKQDVVEIAESQASAVFWFRRPTIGLGFQNWRRESRSLEHVAGYCPKRRQDARKHIYNPELLSPLYVQQSSLDNRHIVVSHRGQDQIFKYLQHLPSERQNDTLT